MSTITFILILGIAAIVAVSIGIARLVSSNSRNESEKLEAQSNQNRLFELGQELERIASLFSNNEVDEACELFLKITPKIDRISHHDFNSIEWKTYLINLKDTKSRLMEFITSNYSQQYQRIVVDKQLKDKAISDKEAKTKKLVDMILIIFASLLIAIAVGLLIFQMSNLGTK